MSLVALNVPSNDEGILEVTEEPCFIILNFSTPRH